MKMPAATKKGGSAAGGPDVCKTPPAPPVPTPYPNMGQVSGADKTVSKVVIGNKETVVESSQIPNSKGDEAGTLKGMVSQTNMKEIKFKKYSSKVYAKGKKIVFHTAATAHNGSNSNAPVGTHASPSQTKVVVAT
ncbi:MAG: PAAR-like domain-containing protein [Polyangiaceae bacterium]